jgi:hypothetical protein
MSNMKKRLFTLFVTALAGVTALLMAGCEMALPTAPSELTTGIVIYERTNFLGKSALVKTSIADLGDFKGPCNAEDGLSIIFSPQTPITTSSWDDCIASIRVTPGWRAIVYRDPDFKGRSLEVMADAIDLKLAVNVGLNREISSIRLFPPLSPF